MITVLGQVHDALVVVLVLAVDHPQALRLDRVPHDDPLKGNIRVLLSD